MIRLFVPQDQICKERVVIRGQDHDHLRRVLRARAGDCVIILDGAGRALRCSIELVARAETHARIEAPADGTPEPRIHITIAQSLGKGDKFEQVVRHGTEIGAVAFHPISADRAVMRPRTAQLEHKIIRWRQIAKAAAEQSGRLRIPYVGTPVTLEHALRLAQAHDAFTVLLDPGTGAERLSEALSNAAGRPQHVWLVVGPEGGWSRDEIRCAEAMHAHRVSLGPRVLRTEIASLVAASQILCLLDGA